MSNLELRVRELERLFKALSDAHHRALDHHRSELIRLGDEVDEMRWRLSYFLAGVESTINNVNKKNPGGRLGN